MAVSTDLVAATTIALGGSSMTLQHYMRQLRDDGLISKTGRGTSAATMTVADAVYLLLAYLGSPTAAGSPKVARMFAGLECAAGVRIVSGAELGIPGRPGRVSKADWSGDRSSWGRLPPGHSLMQSLTQLVETVHERICAREKHRLFPQASAERDPGINLQIRLILNQNVNPGVVQVVNEVEHGVFEAALYGEEHVLDPSRLAAVEDGLFDLVTARVITHRTIIVLIRALLDENRLVRL